MATWRERGYVPDSDDDDEEPVQPSSSQSTGATVHQVPSDVNEVNSELPAKGDHGLFDATPSVASPPSSGISLLEDPRDDFGREASKVSARGGSNLWSPQTAEKSTVAKSHAISSGDWLGKLLSQGLETCREVLSETRQSQPSGSDSPLSSPPTSPLLSQADQDQDQAHNLRNSSQPGSPTRPTGSNVSPLPSTDSPNASLGLGDAAPVRSFRRRNPLQVQPYTLEAAKYQLEWKRRGLRPIRDPVSHDGPQQSTTRQEEESQGAHPFASSQDDSFRAFSPIRHKRQSRDDEESQSPIRGGRTPADIENMQPMKEPAVTVPAGRALRRSALKVPALPPPREVPAQERALKSLTDDLERKRIDALFDMPPSPPRSMSISSRAESIHGLNDLTVTPQLLPTPLLSSEQRGPKRDIVEVSDSSSEDASDDGSEGTGEPSAEEEAHDLVHIRRRIRGVLPASWIRLDAQKQKPGKERSSLSKSPEKAQTRGVARPIARPSSSSTHLPVALDFSSDSDDDASAPPALREDPERYEALRSLIGEAGSGSYDDDVMEEDHIDPMLPQLSRNRLQKARRNPRQRRLEEFGASKELQRRKGPSVPDRTDRPPRKSVPKRSKRKNAARQFTVLDAPGLMKLNSGRRPQFLGVAARSKQQGRAPRPQDPSRKFFKLANHEDTVEVNEELRGWRGGVPRIDTAARSTSNRVDRHSAPTTHYHVSHGNSRPGDVPDRSPRDVARPSALIQMLKESTKATLNNIETSVNDQNAKPDGTTDHDADIRSKKRPGFISWSGNRGGRGNFWANVLSRPVPVAVPRPPQGRDLLPLLNNADHRLKPPTEATAPQHVPTQPGMVNSTLPSRPK
jgi:hypothetical protein